MLSAERKSVEAEATRYIRGILSNMFSSSDHTVSAHEY
jgi:hypothetical protein